MASYLSGYDAAGNAIYKTAETPTAAEMQADQSAIYGRNLDALHGSYGGLAGSGIPGTDVQTETPDTSGGFFSNIWKGIGTVDKFLPSLGKLDSGLNMNPNDKGNIVESVGDAVSGTSAALKFISDIPRVTTTLLGLILIIAGIFALAKGPAVNIVSNAVSGGE